MTEQEPGDGRDGSATAAGPSLVDFARNHPGLFVSGGYFAATLVGMMSSWTVYQRFGIDIFHYAQVTDFALAAVRNPWASLAVLLAVPVVVLIMVSDSWLYRRFPRYKYIYGGERLRRLSRSRPAWLLYLVLYAYAFSLLYAGWFARSVRDGGLPAVEVQLAAGTWLGRDATVPFTASVLGTTSTWVFLYDPGADRATAVPVEAVVSLTRR